MVSVFFSVYTFIDAFSVWFTKDGFVLCMESSSFIGQSVVCLVRHRQQSSDKFITYAQYAPDRQPNGRTHDRFMVGIICKPAQQSNSYSNGRVICGVGFIAPCVATTATAASTTAYTHSGQFGTHNHSDNAFNSSQGYIISIHSMAVIAIGWNVKKQSTIPYVVLTMSWQGLPASVPAW